MAHESSMAMLREAVARHRLRPLDLAFAQFLAERDANAADSCILLAALLSRQLADGHPCLELRALPTLMAEQDWPVDGMTVLDSLDQARPSWLADGSGFPENAPVVRDGQRIYLRRYWRYECQVAQSIHARLDDLAPTSDGLRDELLPLFPQRDDTPLNWPRIACAIASRGRFSVITGGPGTGKTTTVVRLLGLLQTLRLREHARPLRMRLAAPTGKAAARLNASIAGQLAQLDVAAAVRESIPTTVATLHRLLGARADSRRFRHDRHNPLHADVLVIDEASMIDLEMMAAVFDALPAHARLILLGDKDQLSSVEAGAVLGDLCHRADAGHYSARTTNWVRSVSGEDLAAYVWADAQALDQQVAMLRFSHRFAATSGIGRLATAVNHGDTGTAQQLLSGRHADVAWLRDGVHGNALMSTVVDGGAASFAARDDGAAPHGYRHYFDIIRRRPSDETDAAAVRRWARCVLDAHNRFQLLCAVRHGPAGVDVMNRQIATALLDERLIDTDRGWYEGRPVMVNRNDYSLGLMNGDVGIALRRLAADGSMRLSVAFALAGDLASMDDARASDAVRFVTPSRLSDVETVFAMTVHKAQGSEFEHTALVLPDESHGALTRELLYTGVTRARRWFSLVATEPALETAIGRLSQRYSGLSERLAR